VSNRISNLPFTDHLEKHHPAEDIRPKFRDCVLEISAIGVRQVSKSVKCNSSREMLPFRLLHVQKPSIVFDCGGEITVTTKSSNFPSGAFFIYKFVTSI
jgi:hypothetical protein